MISLTYYEFMQILVGSTHRKVVGDVEVVIEAHPDFVARHYSLTEPVRSSV